jgi:hypothetical protein
VKVRAEWVALDLLEKVVTCDTSSDSGSNARMPLNVTHDHPEMGTNLDLGKGCTR